MTYAGAREIHEAGSHIMEAPDWLWSYADEATRAKMPKPDTSGTKEAEDDPDGFFGKALAKQRDPEYRANDATELMLRKNWLAPGAFLKDDRPAALDLLGFKSQLVFNTFANGMLVRAEHAGDEDYAYG